MSITQILSARAGTINRLTTNYQSNVLTLKASINRIISSHTINRIITSSRTISSIRSIRSNRSDRNVPSTRNMSSASIPSYSPSDEAVLFDEVVRSRGFCRTFDKERLIDPLLVENLLRLSQTAPSSFNMQPYKMILVQDPSARESLANAMMGGNPQRVRDAPVTIVYLSDREPVRLAPRLMALEAAAGTDAAYMRDLLVKINVLLGNGGWVAGKVRAIATEIASAISPSPVVHKNPVSWAVKNTIFVAQTFMLLATAHGLGTAPMEGFDERRLCYALGVPMDQYTVPLIISVGYPTIVVKTYGGDKAKRRCALEDMCYADKYDSAWKRHVTIEENNEENGENEEAK